MTAIQFKSLYRGILRNQGIVFINVFGFAAAMACCIHIFLYMADEHAYDRHYTNANRIYRVCLDRIYPDRNVMWATVPPGVRDGLITEFPEVVAATRLRKQQFTVSTERIRGRKASQRNWYTQGRWRIGSWHCVVVGRRSVAIGNDRNIDRHSACFTGHDFVVG